MNIYGVEGQFVTLERDSIMGVIAILAQNSLNFTFKHFVNIRIVAT